MITISLILFCCKNQSISYHFDYGTSIDSARYYFLKGWEEILDNGRWTESESAFRRAIVHDPDWALGKSLVGRITRNLEERLKLTAELEAILDDLAPDERKLVEVNLLSLKAANNRDRGISNSVEFNQKRRQLAEQNFGAFARKYPEDDYFKAEYIEFLHANHGARTALDSIEALTLPRQRVLLFFMTYKASLHLELGDTPRATKLLMEVKEQVNDPSYLSPLVLESSILETEGKLTEAKSLIDKVVSSDTNHLIAKGIQARIAAALAND